MNGPFNLYLTRYAYGVTPATATPLESFGSDHAGFEARCSLNSTGWLEKMYFFVRAKSRADAKLRTGIDGGLGHYGNIIKVHDNCGILLNGWVFDAQPDGLWVRYECVGDKRHLHNAKYDTDLDDSTAVSAAFDDILSVIPQVHVSTTNIDSNTTTIGAFHVEEVTEGNGYYPGDALPELHDMGNTAYETYDMWFQARENLRGIDSQLSTFYYQKRDRTRTYADWYVPVQWLVPGQSVGQGDIYNYASSVVVRYGKVGGTHDGPEGFIHFIDSSENFPALGVSVKDIIVNLTQSTPGNRIYGTVSGISNDGHELATRLHDPSGDVVAFSAGDVVEIVLKSRLGEAFSTATGTTNYWAKQVEVEAPSINNTQAGQLANELATTLSRPLYTRPFSIGGGVILAPGGGEWPVTRLLKRPGHVMIMGNSNSVHSLQLDITAQRGLFVLAVDYSHTSQVMSVTPNMPGDRLDSLLRGAGLVEGEGVSVGGGGDNPFSGGSSLYTWFHGRAAEFTDPSNLPAGIHDKSHRPDNFPWGYSKI